MNQLEENLNAGRTDGAAFPTAGRKKQRVLLIEDENRTRLDLLDKLRTAGFDVEVATNGHLALEKLRSGHPDAIFMDLLLPHLKGVKVIKAARRDPEFGSRPIYVCTSAARMDAWSRRAYRAGATKVFDKAKTPLKEIIAEVAADLRQLHATGDSPAAVSPDKAPSKAGQANGAGSDGPRRVVFQGSEDRARASKPIGTPARFAQFLSNIFGVIKAKLAPSRSAARTSRSPLKLENPPGAMGAGLLEDMQMPSIGQGAAVFTLDESGKILSADATCAAMFGWDAPELVGQNLGALLKEGLAPDVQRFREKHRAGERGAGTSPALVMARRKDGTEFPASVTTLTWSSDTSMTRKSEESRCSWTAVFRDRTSSAGQAKPSRKDLSGVHESPLAPPGATEATRPPSAPPPPRKEELLSCTGQSPELLEAARAAAGSAEAAYKQEVARANQLEQELTRLQQERDELNGKLRAEQQAGAESGRRSAELERRLRETAGELEGVRTELRKHSDKQGNLESELQAQLAAAKASAAQMEAALKEEVQRNKKFEERLQGLGKSLKQEQIERSSRFKGEVASLQQERDELNKKLASEQEAVAESRQRAELLESRLRENTTEFERAKAELEKRIAERQRSESEWREQLKAAEALARKAAMAWKEAVDRNQRFEGELAGLRQERDELNSRLLAEQHAAAESKLRAKELESQLRENAAELERVKAELEKVGSDHRFEQELANLRQVRDELSGKLTAEQEATAESKGRREELENRLRGNSAELERVKAERDKLAQEQTHLESELRAQMNAAKAAAEQVEAALKEKGAKCSQLEKELAGLQQARNELGAKLASEHQTSAEFRQHVLELEARLGESAAELERVKGDRVAQAQEQARLESELRGQVEAAKTTAGRLEAALKAEAARNKEFEERLRTVGHTVRQEEAERIRILEQKLASLHRERDELNDKLAAQQQAAADYRRRNEELDNQRRQSTAELERVKADRDRQAQTRARLESDWQAQLKAAKAAAGQAQAALTEKATQSNRFEQELASLRQERDQLNKKLAAEQQAAAESRRRSEELDSRGRQTTAEQEHLKAAQQKQAQEWAGRESDLLAQLQAAKATAGQAEAALKEKVTQSDRFEQELASLRREREQLDKTLTADQQTVAESRRRAEELDNRLRERTAELEQLKAEQAKQAQERVRLESELQSQLKATKAAAEQAKAALKEKVSQSKDLEQELASLWQECDQLTDESTAQQQAAAESARHSEELENRLREKTAELEQLKAARAKEAEEQARLVSDLQAQLDARKAAAEPHPDAESQERIKQLEKQLRQSATGFAAAKIELEKRASDRTHVESELRAELEKTKTAAQQAGATSQETAARCSRLEEELAGLRQERDELTVRLKTGQQAAEESSRRNEDLENRLRETAAELGRTKCALENRSAEGLHLAPDHPDFAGNTERLGKELCLLRENEAAHLAELSELERRVREGVGALARATADLEKERGERRRVEQRLTALAAQLEKLHEELKLHLESERAAQDRITNLEQQLREREDGAARLSVELQKEAADRQLAKEQLQAAGDMSVQLRKYLSLFEESKKVFKRNQAELESRLQANLNALQQSEARLQKEASERQRLEEALSAAQQHLHEQTEQNALELVRLQSELQVEQFEHKRLEGEAIQSRYSSLDSTRVGRAMVNSFRRQIREPVDKVMQTTRRLLEAELDDNQKQLIESVLENALLLQSSLQESGTLNARPVQVEEERQPKSGAAESPAPPEGDQQAA